MIESHKYVGSTLIGHQSSTCRGKAFLGSQEGKKGKPQCEKKRERKERGPPHPAISYKQTGEEGRGGKLLGVQSLVNFHR